MKNELSKLNEELLILIRAIGLAAEKQGMEAYLVGGFVRDLILKIPNWDVDIVVEGSALKLARVLSAKYKARLVEHPRFGTAVVEFRNGIKVDLATARKETYLHPGALPTVEHGAVVDDLFRRDFTINTLAIAINPNRWGVVIDPFEGREDILRKKIRILHEKSFVDDPTRILRAIRFEQRLKFKIEPRTLSLLKSAIRNKMPHRVKSPRYFEEFKKMLIEPFRIASIRRLQRLGALDFLHKDFRFTPAAAAFIMNIQRDLSGFKKTFPDRVLVDEWLVYFMGMTADFSRTELARVCRRFQLSNKETRMLLWETAPALKDLSRKDLQWSEIYKVLKPLAWEQLIFIKARTGSRILRRKINEFLHQYQDVKIQVTGHDLQKIGIPLGKQIGEVLNKILLQKIDGHLRTREDELRYASRFRCP